MSEWPKKCANCGDEVEAQAWVSLSFVGFQDDGAGGRLELRNHRCGSTLALNVTPNGLTETLRWELATLFRREAEAIELSALSGTPSASAVAEKAYDAARLHHIADALVGDSERWIEIAGVDARRQRR